MKKQNTKEKILNVALKLFSEKSYNGASIREIAKETGIRESAIYNHFKSKEEILSELISIFSKRNFGTLIITDRLINQISNPEKFLQLLSKNILEFWNMDSERMFIKVLLSKNIDYSSPLQYSLDDYFNDFKKLCSFIFDEMMKHKVIKKTDAQVLATEFLSPLFFMEIEMIFSRNKTSGFKYDIKKHIDFFWTAIKTGI